jgi:hypothetical protein
METQVGPNFRIYCDGCKHVVDAGAALWHQRTCEPYLAEQARLAAPKEKKT